MKAYTVNPGHRFVQPGQEVVEGGGTVHLDDAEALRFADRVTLKRGKAAKPATAEAAAKADTDAAKVD